MDAGSGGRMASKFHGGINKKEKLLMQRQTEWLVTHVYAAIGSELYQDGWDTDRIQDLFTRSQERWNDSTKNGWDMLKNFEEVVGVPLEFLTKESV